MVEVTANNFNQLLPEILADIKSASFIAVDTEFTGLLSDEVFVGSLFDDGPHRYQKLISNMRRFSICQLGLAVFKGIPNVNKYTVTSYNFYLRPHSCNSFDPTFMCQASSLEFLQKYQFDFNKWLYGGITFMNTNEAEELRSDLLSFMQGNKGFRLSFEVQDQLSNIGQWAATAQEGDTTTCSVGHDITSQVLLVASTHNKFTDLWAGIDNDQVVIKKVSADERTRLEAQDPQSVDFVEGIVSRMQGFTTVFQYLAQHQKPIVFHNSLLDLLLIYKQFHRHLPQSYSAFKTDLHQMFPIIYDTKFIATELRYHYKEKDDEVSILFNNTSLYDLASSMKRASSVLYKPSLIHHPPVNKYSGDKAVLHEAGYDAYVTGMCFLSMAHLYTMLMMTSRLQHRPLSPQEHVYALKNFANRVHIPRATISYMELTGRDPRSKRPPWLLVEPRNRSVRVTPGMVSTTLAQYGSLDVIRRNNSSVLVATANWKCVRDILMNLSEDSRMKAQLYKRLKHSPLIRTLAWSGALVSTGFSAWIVYTTLRRTS
ncbi:poly(A)-specific ribonuclease PNLDC1-like [Homarus americanus]|uniref:poly(A)-specific ribonuclease PNLDC1-like n=1 Tax=Homarus americanus TaxID=6706 RepID=UPI001C487D12|nr:poly(A)-specific ribonuclease PNLDC1-like [Homarus americanus]